MKRTRIRIVGVAVLFTFLMLGTLTMSAMAEGPTVILVRQGEGATVYYIVGDGTEPPPHILIIDKDGNIHQVDPNRNP